MSHDASATTAEQAEERAASASRLTSGVQRRRGLFELEGFSIEVAARSRYPSRR
jgi:hypothetical protein